MLEPVKRTNFDLTKSRNGNLNKLLFMNKFEKKNGKSPSPKKSLDTSQLSPTKQNDETNPQNIQIQKQNTKNSSPRHTQQYNDQSRNNSQQTNRTYNNMFTFNPKKVEFQTPNQFPFYGHRKSQSQSQVSLPLSSSGKVPKQIKINEYFLNQFSPTAIKNNHNNSNKSIPKADQYFFSTKTSSLHGSQIFQQSDHPTFAFGNQTQGLPSEYGQRSMYINLPKTAGMEKRERINTQNSSRVAQAFLDQFLQKAQLLNQAENKVYNIYVSKNDKNETPTLSQSGLFQNGSQQKSSSTHRVTSLDQFQSHVLSSTLPETYFLSSHNFYYFVIHTRGKQSPLKLSVKIKTPTEGYQNRIKGFISKTSNRPNTFNSDDEFDGRSYKLYAEGGKKIFNLETLYFSLYPEIDMTIKIKVGFGEQKIQMSEAYILYKKHKQKVQEENNMIILQQQRERDLKVYESMNSSQNKKPSLSQFLSANSSPVQSSANLAPQNKVGQSVKEKRIQLKSSEGQKRRNITLYNKFNMPDMFDKYQKLIRQKEDNIVKQSEVQERKNQIIQNKSSDVEEKVRISSLRSQFQIEKKKLVERISKFQLWQLVWIKIIKQVTVLKMIHDKLEIMKKQKLISMQANFIALRAVVQWIKKLRKIGSFPEERAISQACIATNKIAQMLSKKCNSRAENIICNYLQQSSRIIDLKNKGVSLISRVIGIQRQWRETKQKKKRFKELIVRQFQSKYSEYLYEIRIEIRRQKDPFYQPKQIILFNQQYKYNLLIQIGIILKQTLLRSQISNKFVFIFKLKFISILIIQQQSQNSVLLSQVVSSYLMQHLRKYYEMYEIYRSALKLLNQMSEEQRRHHAISVAMKKPVFFRLPKASQLKQMVREYAELKQLII